MSEPDPSCRSDHSPLTGTVAHRRRHHQDCENRVHVQNQPRSSPENDFAVASANITGCLSPKATHMTRQLESTITSLSRDSTASLLRSGPPYWPFTRAAKSPNSKVFRWTSCSTDGVSGMQDDNSISDNLNQLPRLESASGDGRLTPIRDSASGDRTHVRRRNRIPSSTVNMTLGACAMLRLSDLASLADRSERKSRRPFHRDAVAEPAAALISIDSPPFRSA
jgi:hypothetical protein